jgi:thioredoxin reductase/Pyruvate/2-oxoacid:ferredoxin oxidoreductase delta subunit
MLPDVLTKSVSSWAMVLAPALAFGLALLSLVRRRGEIRRFEESHRARQEARARGSDKARLLHPEIDLAKCIGCGSCVRECPEEGVLDLLHGQAVVVHGSRCVGHGRCAEACPTGAIALTFGDLSERSDLPAVHESLEAVGVPGLYLAGEISGYSLVRTAVAHGSGVASAVAKSLRGERGGPGEDAADLLIAGAGPAGLSCGLRARELGLSFVIIDQAASIGGTVAAYPRRKLVMTQPVSLPLHGKMNRSEYLKEELVELWQDLASEHDLPVRTGVTLHDLARGPDGVFVAQTSAGEIRARRVCLALGRRGAPRRLGVAGEQLSKVCYSLLDAESYRGRRVLVVGGGDSAVEAAMALALQEGNEVTLSYRGKDFVRIKGRNEARVRPMIQSGLIRAIFESNLVEVTPESVRLKLGESCGGREEVLANDDVFIFAGGEAPFGLLGKAGVSFAPEDRPPPEAVEQSNALLAAVVALLAGAVGMIAWAGWHSAYYSRAAVARPGLIEHEFLRPGGRVGLTLGVLACGLFAWNLTYLLRRSARWGSWIPGSVKFWMGTHIFSGFFGVMCVLAHSGYVMKGTVGGFALLALLIVVGSGTVGRYFYSLVPRAANGRETDLEEVRTKLAALSTQWGRTSRGFGDAVRDRIDALVDRGRWHASLLGRIRELLMASVRLRRTLRELRLEGQRQGVPEVEVREALSMARSAYRLTLQIAHYEEIRAVLATWRYFHRWLALLMVLLVVAHVWAAVKYATLDWPFLGSGAGVRMEGR